LSFTTIADFRTKRPLFLPDSTESCAFGRRMHGKVGTQAAARSCAPQSILRHPMNDEPKSAAELKEIRVNRKLAQDAEGIKAMADIAAADIAIRKRTENLRAIRLAKEAADRANPPEPKAKAKPKKKKST
jgi:hypothetical protein